MSIIVHHLENSRSQRILWLLEELKLDYQVKTYFRDKVTNLAPPELTQIHPLGKSPLVEVDGQLIAESGAIVEYLCTKFDGKHLLRGPESDEYIPYLEFLHFAEGSAMTPVLMNIYAMRLGDAAAPLMPRIQSQLEAHFAYMENALAKTGFFAGAALSAADILMSFPAEIAVMNLGDKKANIKRFVDACHARPAWQKARGRGGPYFNF